MTLFVVFIEAQLFEEEFSNFLSSSVQIGALLNGTKIFHVKCIQIYHQLGALRPCKNIMATWFF